MLDRNAAANPGASHYTPRHWNVETWGCLEVEWYLPLTRKERSAYPPLPYLQLYNPNPLSSHQHSSTCRDKGGAIFDLLYQAICSISRRTTTLTSTVNTAWTLGHLLSHLLSM
jgi:hypothetical protein